MLRSRQIRASLLAVLTLGVAAGCSKTDSAPPVASVSVTLNRTSVALGGVLELTYRFQVEPDAKISGDYIVFAHLNREDGTTIWNDDHPLPEGMRTSQWQPGQVIEYTRTRFIPRFSYIGPATLEVGLYRDDARLPLKGPNPADRDAAGRAYRVATLELQPQTSRIQIYQLSGWYGPEYASDDPAVEWRWTQKVASFSLRNPKQDVTLFIEYDVMNNLPDGPPQQASVWSGDTKVGGFTADAKMPTSARIPISAAQLGTGEMAELRLELDRTFVPARLSTAGHDTRDLGIRVFHLHVEPR